VNVLDINLAGKHLGWMPTTGFEEGMANTLAWMRSGQHV
jgi:nucleoside-diphosphate-sugar epimerase